MVRQMIFRVLLVAFAVGLGCVSSAFASFGVQTSGPEAFSVVVSNSADPSDPEVANSSDLDTQAGSHPYDMTTTFRLEPNAEGELTSELLTRDVSVMLPAGFAGSITSVPQCPMVDLSARNGFESGPGCPTSSQVGVVSVYTRQAGHPFLFSKGPVYNMVPADGGTAELAFPVSLASQPIIVKARTDGDYGLNSTTRGITEYVPFDGLTLTLWGVPADPRHDAERYTPANGAAGFSGGGPPGGPHGEPLPDSAPLSAYLTNPTKCGGPLYAKIAVDPWSAPGAFDAEDGFPDLTDPNWFTANTPMYPAGVTGCDRMRFNPSLTVTPDTTESDSPSGYSMDLHVPQSTAPQDLSTPALENAIATLPQGLAINPGAADGLQACTDDQADPPSSAGNEIGVLSEQEGRFSNIEPTCPVASQVGSVELTTPLLPYTLYGQVFLSADHTGNQYAVFMVIRGEGLLVKLKSTVVANPVTGQLTATFANDPELPFEDFKLHFYGGPRAVFVNPTNCGPATTTTDLQSWASGPGGLPDATPSSTFEVSFDGHGAACPSPQPFEPSFNAGTTSIQAGGFSPLIATFARHDTDQKVDHVQLTAPPGLLGSLADVPLCEEPQASQGTCSSASQIGHVVVGVGSGAAPLYLPIPGQPPAPVYVTGPYRGAPFGLTFVVPAVAGPYNLGNVVVRAAITVDPNTAQLTVTSDPLPTVLDGIPVQVKAVNVVIDRPNFMFNPTNCSPMSIAGRVTSLQGSTASLSSAFQVTGCGDLTFKPQFSVSTSAHTSRANGASLDARLSYPVGSLGHAANIASVKVELPKRLPSRLTTLQKACPAATFNTNPANCSQASVIGIVKANTPALPVELTGPVYFVSHGGEAFPNLIAVLQGDGVRVDLVGSTFISKSGITSSTFKSVPDVPVNSFELYLPEGPNSALAANGNLCKGTLTMPTTFTAQNGRVLHQTTPIAVTGCGKAKAKSSRARAAGRRHKHGAKAAHRASLSRTGKRRGN